MGGCVHPEREWGEFLMPVSVYYYRNYDASDTTEGRWRSMSTYYEEPSIDYFSWVPPDGYTFKEWNTARDGSGTASHPGEEVTGDYRYAIWEQIPDPVPYLVTDTELASVADAIRTKGGTSAALEWPSGFAQAIADIPSGGGSDFKLVPVILKSASNYQSTVTIPEVGPDDMVTVFSSFGDAGSFFADYGAANPYVQKNVNGAVTFKLRTNLSYPLGVLVAVFSNLELQVFGQDSDIVSNRKPAAGETVTVSKSSAGASGTYTMYYYDLVTGEEVQYASSTGTTYSGSFTMPNHSVYLRASFSGGGNN